MKQPTINKTVLKIEYNTEKSSFSNKQHLEVKVPITVKSTLKGKYQSELGILSITKDSDKDFDFNVKISGVGTPAKFDGTAIKEKANKFATFVDPEYGCKVTFFTDKDTILLKEQNAGCLKWHGPSISTDGTYKKVSGTPDTVEPTVDAMVTEKTAKDKEDTLTTEQIVPFNIDEEIQSLVGKDYPLLVESTKKYETGYDLDGLNTEVIKGEITPRKMESMIMSDSNNYLYVGLIINEKKVRFYTNNPIFKDQLPRTF